MVRKFISRHYNQRFEDICVRVLYFFNTIDTYYLIAGMVSFVAYLKLKGIPAYSLPVFITLSVVVFVIFKVSDFYPLFVVLSPLYLFFLLAGPGLTFKGIAVLGGLNLVVFIVVQVFFMSIPESIVARDATIGIRKIWNSVLTIAPTTVSMSMSLFFSMLYALVLVIKPGLRTANGAAFWMTIAAAAAITYYFKPRSFRSDVRQPAPAKQVCEKIIMINIDGCRLDRFYEAQLPFLTALRTQSSYFPRGLYTVYRGLTNPAFASILTGTVPEVHGIKSNNIGRPIRVEGLPDLVKTILYGSMHVKHFSKAHWDTRIVSMPRHGAYKTDDIMFDWLKEDLLKKTDVRLLIADISETDFLGHAYGSGSHQYLAALQRADKRIEGFFGWRKKHAVLDDSIVIICSDHGMVQIDHSYLLFDAEKRVPFLITGPGIKANNPLEFEASIMDIAPTICYLLGLRYPDRCRARMLGEVIV